VPYLKGRYGRLTARVAVTLVVGVVAADPARAQLGLFKRGSTSYQPFKDPAGRFTLEYPKDWRVLPGGGSVLVGFTHKDGEASILVDYMKMRLALAPNEIGETFAELELQTLRERQPTIKDARANVVAAASGPRIVIQFSKAGPTGTEQVTQYSIPRGEDLYRLVCTVRSDKVEKNGTILTHMVESFAVSTPKE